MFLIPWEVRIIPDCMVHALRTALAYTAKIHNQLANRCRVLFIGSTNQQHSKSYRGVVQYKHLLDYRGA